MTLFEVLLLLGLIFIVCLVVVGGKLLLDLARRRDLNFRRLACPKCGATSPLIRKPLNQRQALYGGWTCTNCGVEMDRWGTDISADKDFIALPKRRKKKWAIGEDGLSPIEKVFKDSE